MRVVVDVAGAATLAEHRVQERVDEDVARRDAELGEEALDALAGLADEDAPADRLVRRRILAEHEHPRRAVEPAAVEDRSPLGAERVGRVDVGARRRVDERGERPPVAVVERPPIVAPSSPRGGAQCRRPRRTRSGDSAVGPASASSVCSRTSAPAVTSAGWVCSAMLCESPPTLGVKIIAAGQMRASIWASWPAPLGIRRVEWPSRRAVASTRSIVAGSKSTGSKRASDRVVDRDALGRGQPRRPRRPGGARPPQQRLVGVAQVDGQHGARWRRR